MAAADGFDVCEEITYAPWSLIFRWLCYKLATTRDPSLKVVRAFASVGPEEGDVRDVCPHIRFSISFSDGNRLDESRCRAELL